MTNFYLSEKPDWRRLIAIAGAGMVGLAALFIIELLLGDGESLPLGKMLILVISGGLMLGLAELISLLGNKRWQQGVLFGLTIGIGAGVLMYLVYEDYPFLESFFSGIAGGLLGGLFLKIWGGLGNKYE